MEDIASAVARRAARRLPWLEEEEVRQDILLALVNARRTHDQSRGAWEPYAWTTARATVAQSLARTAPFTPGRRCPFGLVRLSADTLDDTLVHDVTPEDIVASEQFLRAARKRLYAVLRWHPKDYAAASSVLLGEEAYAEAANKRSVPVRAVYKAAARLRAAIRRDDVLFQIWKEAL